MLGPLIALLVGQSPTVTLSIPAARVPVVLEAISRQVGEKLAADAVMSREVVCLRVVAAPRDELLAKLADAVGGEWKRRDGITTLSVSESATRQAHEERCQSRARLIAEAVSKWSLDEDRAAPLTEGGVLKIAEAAKDALTKPQGPGEKKLDAFFEKIVDPKWPLFRSLVRRIPPSQYVGLAEGERIVFSDSPTSMQSAMPRAADEAIVRFRNDERLARQYLAPVIQEALARFDPHHEGDLQGEWTTLPDRFKVDLAVQYEGVLYGDAPTFELNLVDPTGQVLANIKEDPDDLGVAKVYDPPSALTPSTPPKSRAAFHELLNYIHFINPDRPEIRSGTAEQRAQWRSEFLDPVKNEPLALIGLPTLAVAEADGVNLVADLDDRYFARSAIRGTIIPGRDLEKTFGFWADALRTPGWITIRPRDFEEVRNNRLDRSAAKQLFGRIVASDGMSIDDAAQYLRSTSGGLADGQWDQLYAAALEIADGRSGAFAIPYLDADAFRLYGSVSPDLRDRLRTEGLRVFELSTETRARLSHDFYAQGDDPQSDSGEGYEPTDALPDGLPETGLLRQTADTTSLVVVPVLRSGKEDIALDVPLTAARLGMILGMPASSRRSTFPYSHFRLGHMRRITLEAEYAPQLHRKWTLAELFYTTDPIAAWDDLPADFRDQADAARKRREEILRRRGDRQASPPPD